MYNNFVKSATVPCEKPEEKTKVTISGEEAKRLYTEEINNISPGPSCFLNNPCKTGTISSPDKREKVDISDKEIFIAAQNNDEELMKQVLEDNPDKVQLIDEYGWSLLMIACQANSTDVVKVLLDCGVDTSIRDKAGNSAQNLVIRNKNLVIADLLLGHRTKVANKQKARHKRKKEEQFYCEICNNVYTDKEQHLSSTVHNISASKSKKIPTCYRIPESNRGFQMMLRTGWNKDSGLGINGSGIKYPLKPIEKKDRKGLGHKKVEKNTSIITDNCIPQHKHLTRSKYHKNKQLEINFRREFY